MRRPARDNRSIAAKVLRRGDRVCHPDHGTGTVQKVRKSDGAVFLRMDADGIVGTVAPELLSWHPGRKTQ